MNRTVVFIVFAVLCGLAIVGSVVLHLLRPDTALPFIGTVVTVLGLASVFAGTAYGLGKVNEKVEQVRKQTNGTTHKVIQLNEQLTQLLVSAVGIDPKVLRELGVDTEAVKVIEAARAAIQREDA